MFQMTLESTRGPNNEKAKILCKAESIEPEIYCYAQLKGISCAFKRQCPLGVDRSLQCGLFCLPNTGRMWGDEQYEIGVSNL